MQLYPFYQAYNRPYPAKMSWREYREAGFDPIEKQTVGLEDIESTWDELAMFRIDAEGNVTTEPPDSRERATWVERKINGWTRRKEWTL